MSGEKTYRAEHRNPLMQSEEAFIVLKASVTMEGLIHGVGKKEPQRSVTRQGAVCFMCTLAIQRATHRCHTRTILPRNGS